MASLSYAFPAVDRDTVQSLAGSSAKNVDSNTIVQQINQAEVGNLVQSLNNAEATSNNALSYSMMLNRNKTIRDIATDLTTQNKRVNNGAKDTYSRQSEINEWAAQNKYDTLFFLQTTFIYFCLVVISLYFRQSGIFPDAVFYIILGLGLLIVIGILWNRSSYTSASRDKRFWNRRFLGLDDSNLAAQMQCSLQSS
jgi:hypothetical protein